MRLAGGGDGGVVDQRSYGEIAVKCQILAPSWRFEGFDSRFIQSRIALLLGLWLGNLHYPRLLYLLFISMFH